MREYLQMIPRSMHNRRNMLKSFLNSKDLTDKDSIKAALKDYTDDSFTDEEIVTDETGKAKVIIKFTWSEKAKEFVWKVNEGRSQNIIKKGQVLFQLSSGHLL